MRKNGPKEQPERPRALALRWVLALILVCLLAAPIAVQAELKATSLAYSWDVTSYELEWGHATIEWDGSWIPLFQEIYFDQLDRPSESPDPPLCAVEGEVTRYAGWIEYGLPFLDNDPDGARGFQESRKWAVVQCDLNQDGTWDDADLQVGPLLDLDLHPELVLAECGESEHCQILRMDDPTVDPGDPGGPAVCTVETAEHCAYELAVRLWVNIDTDCDGVVDAGFPVDPATGEPEPLCVYAEAETPHYEAGEDVWTFPLPVRISDKNGAKTLMLYPGPTAVGLASFKAELQGRNVLLSWETAKELDNLGFNVYRANAAGGERVRVNGGLIPSQSLASTVGSSYQFLDRSAEPDMAYHYWLEDIDLGGASTMNGPVAVHTPRVRRLPCRSRPGPMPGQME